MTCAVLENQLHRALAVIDDQTARACEIDRRLVGARRVGEEHVAPAARRHYVADVDDAAGEALIEGARLDVAFRLGRDDAERDLAEGLVGVRQRHEQHVLVGGERDDGQDGDRPQRAEDADAARLQRHELAVGRQPAEPHQDAVEQRHRDRDAQRLRHQRQQDANDGRRIDPFFDQLLRVLEHRRHQQDEGEHHQREEKGEQDLANQVAVEDIRHGRVLDYTV